MEDEPDILLRVLFELALTEGGDEVLVDAVESAVTREDMQNAGAMPDFNKTLGELRTLVLNCYYSSKKEKGLL